METKTYQCPHCEQILNTPLQLGVHLKTAHKDKPKAEKRNINASCRKGCGKIFKTYEGRKNHEATCQGGQITIPSSILPPSIDSHNTGSIERSQQELELVNSIKELQELLQQNQPMH